MVFRREGKTVRKVYAALAGLQLLAVLAQFYFAAVGAFAKPQDDRSFALHSLTGMLVIPVLSLLATIVAALARVGGRLVALTLLPLGLVVVQVLIITAGDHLLGSTEDRTTPGGLVILGLHALNGLGILGVAAQILNRARGLLAQPAAERSAQPAA
jgi:hypothetical protein